MESSEDIGAGRKQVRFDGEDVEIADRFDACCFESCFEKKSFDVAGVYAADALGIVR